MSKEKKEDRIDKGPFNIVGYIIGFCVVIAGTLFPASFTVGFAIEIFLKSFLASCFLGIAVFLFVDIVINLLIVLSKIYEKL